VLLALRLADARRPALAGAAAGAAAALGVWPAALLVPLAAVVAQRAPRRRRQSALGGLGGGGAAAVSAFGAAAAAACAALLVAGAAAGAGAGGWDRALRGYVRADDDFTPSLGFWWYVFMELFREFFPFYTFVMHALSLVWVLPISWRFRDRPLFALWAAMASVVVFKPHLIASELLLCLHLLPAVSDVAPPGGGSVLLGVLLVYVSVSLPVTWDLWLGAGAGNPNFFFGMTIVQALLAGLVLKFALTAAMTNRARDIAAAGSLPKAED
jgi:hypothetical protein